MATGELADAIHRDLITDQQKFDDLGWRGLWAYITQAQPGTAIYYEQCEGMPLTDRILARQLDEQREIRWRYTRVHFDTEGRIPFPEKVHLPGDEEQPEPAKPLTLEEAVSPQVRALLQGG